MIKKCKIFNLLLLSFCIGTIVTGSIPQGNVYANNSTDITFEIVEPEGQDEADSEDIEGENILLWEAGQDWIIGRSTKSIVTFYLPRNSFTRISLDNQELTEGQDYTISGNYTTITFKKDFLNKLSEGRHDIVAHFADLNEEEGESSFSTYLTVYTEESAAAANIATPNTGFFAAIEEIATSSLPVVVFLGAAALCIFGYLKLRIHLKRLFTSIQKRVSSILQILFLRPTKRCLSIASEKLHDFKPFNQSLKITAAILTISAITGGFGVLFHNLSNKQSEAASTLNLGVNTSLDIRSTLSYSDPIARVTDTVTVNAEPGIEYDIYMSAGNDNHLRADGTNKAFSENTNIYSLSDGSWGFTTEENGAVFSSVPKKGEEVLVAHVTEPGETKIYFAAKAGEGFEAGSYKGTVNYTIVAKSTNPVSIALGSDDISDTLTITTPIVKNGDMNIEAPEVKIGEDECLSPNMQATDNQYITIICNVPEGLAPGNYNVSLDFPGIEQELNVENGYTEPDPIPAPDPTPDPTPDPEPDPTPEPEITYYTVSTSSSNSSYGSTNRTSTSVAAGTTFTSSGNTLTFSDGRTVVATPKTIAGYNTSCSGWTPANGTVTSDIAVTVNCTRTANDYTMNFRINDSSLGTISVSSASVPYDTTYSTSGATLSFANGIEVTAFPETLTGYTITCSGWSPSSGKVSGDTIFTATCTKKAKANTVTYISPNGQSKVYTESSHSIRALAEFAGARYSNVYSLNSTTYKDWTKEGYYFDYWEGNDGNKYAPAAEDEGHNPYHQCTTCKSTYDTSSAGLVLTPHYTKMNNLNLAAITLAWPDGYTSNDKMIASNKSEGWSHYVTLSSPYSKKMERYKVVATPEFRANAAEYYTDANRRASLEAANLASNKCDNYHSLGCSGTWYVDDIGYFYGRSCDRTAAIATYYAIKGLGNSTIRIPFGLPAQARYFASGSEPWIAINTEDNTRTSSSSAGTAINAGRLETYYQPGDIRLVYRTSSKHENYKLSYDGNTYVLGHIAMYVKTEDGLSHIAEGGHAKYLKNGDSYNGDFIFAHTAYTNGGSFDHLSPFYYKTTTQGYDKDEWYAIWRYNGSGN